MRDVLRPVLPELSDEIIAAIGAEVPGYERAMEGTFGDIVRLGVETALGRFADQIDAPGTDVGGARETYVDLGRGEYHAGRTLDALLAAYRLGARLAWRRFVEAGVRAGAAPDELYALGESIFAYIDELSAASVEGYAEEQTRAAGEAQRRRRALGRLLATEPTAEALRVAADDAAWRVPKAIAALVAAEAADADALERTAQRVAGAIGPDALGAAIDGAAVVWVPDPEAPGRARAMERAAGHAARAGGRSGARASGAGARASDSDSSARASGGPPADDAARRGACALGPAVAPAEGAASLRRALAAHRLTLTGRLPARPLVRAQEHLPELLFAADPALAADLAARELAPLDALSGRTRARLTETLAAWLDRPGQVQAVAAELGVHPQTVRYRLKALREAFGARLEEPDGRFALALALRARGQPVT